MNQRWHDMLHISTLEPLLWPLLPVFRQFHCARLSVSSAIPLISISDRIALWLTKNNVVVGHATHDHIPF
jgi:hypothetical protein